MTREEAIRWLTNEKWTNANNKYKKEWNEAFGMAIEALSADAVSDAYKRGFEDCKGAYEIELARSADRELANLKSEFESADAVQREWIIHGEPPWLVRECSECGAKWHQWSGDKTPNYCGNCGARMEANE